MHSWLCSTLIVPDLREGIRVWCQATELIVSKERQTLLSNHQRLPWPKSNITRWPMSNLRSVRRSYHSPKSDRIGAFGEGRSPTTRCHKVSVPGAWRLVYTVLSRRVSCTNYQWDRIWEIEIPYAWERGDWTVLLLLPASASLSQFRSQASNSYIRSMLLPFPNF